MTADLRATLRRQKIASLLLRGLSTAEIALQLKRQKVRDPETGAPYPLSVIQADVAALDAGWQAEADSADSGRLLAELRETRRAAWAQGDIKAVQHGIKLEAELRDLPRRRGGQADFTRVSEADKALLVR